MAELGPAGSLRAEASCPLCLAFFQEPVSIHCGHNFCRPCIESCWENSRESFPCPRCRLTAPERSLRPNRELAEIIRIAQRLSLRGRGGEGERLCRRHGEVLKLFCEEEQTPVCRVCRESRDHRLHAAVPIEEAAQEHKVGGARVSRRMEEVAAALFAWQKFGFLHFPPLFRVPFE
ncbi:hypothetical protein DV515_00019512 [Chloebia gouldiae]|uniref:RING-type domain-containing protein n=1 Tax=Chloebia gouldiae TaxID=44316 RepID=A0A3L8Q4X4_CHLGU|nr:hypothetical protein DV515_00019512 [Chloebia gouldiae]